MYGLNIIDADSRELNSATFEIPDCLKAVSLNEKVDYLPSNCHSERERHYILVSQEGAVTFSHVDHSATSVFYAVMRGSKIFYLIQPTENNKRVWMEHQDSKPKNSIFALDKDLDPPCEKVWFLYIYFLCIKHHPFS